MGSKIKKLSYNNKLFLVVLLFIWGIIASILVFQYYREKQYKTESLNAQLQIHNQYLINAIESGEDYKKHTAENIAPFDSIRITIISLDGAVVYDSKLNANSLDNHIKRQEIADALKDGSGVNIGRQSNSDGCKYFYSATKGERVIVRSAIPYSDSLKELLKADMLYLWAIISISVIFSVVAYFTSRRLGNNITKLKQFAQDAEKGEKINKQLTFPSDDLGKISNSIISLYSDLQQTITERDMEHEAMLREEQEKIRIKRQLSNNITHELKTPVASIQVCLETILSGMQLSNEKKEELLNRSYANCRRLRHLLNDVSLITRMEEGGMLIPKETIDLSQIIQEAIDEANLQNDTSFAIHSNIDEPLIIQGNRSLVSSIFSNLINNAMSYSGGKNIYINLESFDNNNYNFTVEDDGTGIEEIHLSRIFERFYRIDKGRSRKLGGTGLGLSIVKHAVIFHGGIITATNRPEGGLKFTFSLQKQT